MFNPSREQIRQFFYLTWHKHLNHSPLTPLEAMALDIMLLHPEYHTLFSGTAEDIDTFEQTHPEATPFLHLSLHLAISEQLSIDQPPGIKAAFIQLHKTRDTHDAYHILIECLMKVLDKAKGNMPDSQYYLELIAQKT